MHSTPPKLCGLDGHLPYAAAERLPKYGRCVRESGERSAHLGKAPSATTPSQPPLLPCPTCVSYLLPSVVANKMAVLSCLQERFKQVPTRAAIQYYPPEGAGPVKEARHNNDDICCALFLSAGTRQARGANRAPRRTPRRAPVSCGASRVGSMPWRGWECCLLAAARSRHLRQAHADWGAAPPHQPAESEAWSCACRRRTRRA